MILKSEIRNPKSETIFKPFNFGNFKFVSRFVLCASCLLVLTVPLSVFAQGFVPLAPIPGLTQGVTADTAGLATFFNNLYKFAIGFAAALAVIMIIWGGLEYSTQDSISKKSDGKQRIYNAIFGLVLVLSPVLVFSIINPNILNLSINLERLDTSSGPSSGTGNVIGTQAPVTEQGCSVTGDDYFKTAVCPSMSAATSFNCGSSGLSLRIPSCRNTNPQGTCLDTSFTAYCAGKTTTLTYYNYYRGSGIYKVIFMTNAPVIPRDSAARDSFVNSCTSQGGRVTTTATAATNARMATRAWVMANGCPDDSGIVIDTSQHPGAACFTYDLSCDAPS